MLKRKANWLLCTTKKGSMGGLYVKTTLVVHTLHCKSIIKGFNGSNNYLYSAQFSPKWATRAELSFQTMKFWRFDQISLVCLHAGLHKLMGFHHGYVN